MNDTDAGSDSGREPRSESGREPDTSAGGGPDPIFDPDDRLSGLRDEIRAVDRALVELIGRRLALVLEIGEAKKAIGLPVLDPTQEARVVRRAAELAREHGVDEEMIRDVVWRIMASARDAQEGRTRWGPPLQDDVSDVADDPDPDLI